MSEYRLEETEETPYLYLERTCSMAPEDVGKNMEIAFRAVGEFIDKCGVTSAGKALSVYPTYDENTMTFRAGYLVSAGDAAKADGEVKAGVLPAGRALNTIHRGPYTTLRATYGEMMAYMAKNGLQFGTPTWEIYLNDPAGVASEDELETDIYVMLAQS